MSADAISAALEAGIRCHDAGDLQQAEQHYQRVLKADPRHAKATYLMGLLAHQVGKHELAVRIFGAAIQLDEQQPTFHARLGETYRSLGRIPEAIASYRQALRLNPQWAEFHNNLGTLLQFEGDIPAAIESYRQAIRLQADYAAPHHNLGFSLQQEGQIDAAAEEFAAAVRIQPDYFEANLALASMWQAQGKSQQSPRPFRTVAAAIPAPPQVSCARCWASGRGRLGRRDGLLPSRASSWLPTMRKLITTWALSCTISDRTWRPLMRTCRPCGSIRSWHRPGPTFQTRTWVSCDRMKRPRRQRRAVELQPRSNSAQGNPGQRHSNCKGTWTVRSRLFAGPSN